MPADGNIIPLRSSREVAWRTGLRVVEGHPQAPAGVYGYPEPERITDDADFEIDRRAGCAIWTATGLRLREADDFRQLGNLFLTNGWPRSFNALLDAELALSAVPPEAA